MYRYNKWIVFRLLYNKLYHLFQKPFALIHIQENKFNLPNMNIRFLIILTLLHNKNILFNSTEIIIITINVDDCCKTPSRLRRALQPRKNKYSRLNFWFCMVVRIINVLLQNSFFLSDYKLRQFYILYHVIMPHL